MKKLKSLFAALFTVLVLFSCEDSSQNVTPQKDEAYYKVELAKLLHTEFKDIANQTGGDQNSMKFKSFEEAYIFFNSLKNKPVTVTETLLPMSVTTYSSESARVMYGTAYTNYYWGVQSLAKFGSIHVTGTITASYTVSVTGAYPYKTDVTGVNRIFTGNLKL